MVINKIVPFLKIPKLNFTDFKNYTDLDKIQVFIFKFQYNSSTSTISGHPVYVEIKWMIKKIMSGI
jgi:hypothetical protein